MKLTLFLTAAAFAGCALADRLVSLAWEPSAQQAADGYRVWNSTGPEPVLLASTTEPTAEVEIPDAEQMLTVTAWSLTGESGHSLPLTLPPTEPPVRPPDPEPPVPPGPVTVELRLKRGDVPFSPTAQTIAIHFLTETDPKKFYHLEIITTP